MNLQITKTKVDKPFILNAFHRISCKLFTEGLLTSDRKKIERLEIRLKKLDEKKKTQEHRLKDMENSISEAKEKRVRYGADENITPVEFRDSDGSFIEKRLSDDEINSIEKKAGNKIIKIEAKMGLVCERLSDLYGKLMNTEKQE